MAYLNEFPNLKPNELNMNWILEQYSTFNERLEEIVNEFHSAVEEIERQFENYQNSINESVKEYSEKVDTINKNIGGYVDTYLTENINTILVDNPVLETKYTKIGYIDTNETCTLELEQNKLYEIMTIDFALNMHKALAVNNAFKITSAPFDEVDFVKSISVDDIFIPGEPGTLGYHVSGYPINAIPGVVYEPSPLISATSSSNILTITNNGTNRIRVYYKIIGEL